MTEHGLSSFASDEKGLVMACPNCGQRNRIAYEKIGLSFRCGKCKTELQLPGEVVEVKSDTNFDALIGRSPLPVLIDFWAPWCGPCRMTTPELVKVALARTGSWIIAKVGTEHLPHLAQRFQISAIPTMAVFEGGREVARQAGAMLAPAIQSFMEKSHAK